MPIRDHIDHIEKWYKKPGDQNIIVCSKCDERLYSGRLPDIPGEKPVLGVSLEDVLHSLGDGEDNRTIDEIWFSLPPHTKKLDKSDISEATEIEGQQTEMPNHNFEVVDDTDSVPSDDGSVEITADLDTTTVVANYTVTTHFSRTVSDPTASFGSITCGMDVSETVPGTLDGETIKGIAADHYALVKSIALTQLGRQFSMNDEGVIHEVFPESTTVGRSAPARPAPGRSPGRQTSSGTSRASAPARPSQGRSSGRQATVPDTEALWYELTENPGDWFWNQNKTKDNQPDYYSLKHYQATGFPVALWEMDQQGNDTRPNDDDWRFNYDNIPEDEFAQERPGPRGNRR